MTDEGVSLGVLTKQWAVYRPGRVVESEGAFRQGLPELVERCNSEGEAVNRAAELGNGCFAQQIAEPL